MPATEDAQATDAELKDKYHLIIAALVGLNGWTAAKPLTVPMDRLYDAGRLAIVIKPDPNGTGVLIYGEPVAFAAARSGARH